MLTLVKFETRASLLVGGCFVGHLVATVGFLHTLLASSTS